MHYPVLIARMAEIQRETVRQGMAGSRPVKNRPDCAPGFQERLALRVGAALIAAGQRLQAPYEPASGQEPEAYRSGC